MELFLTVAFNPVIFSGMDVFAFSLRNMLMLTGSFTVPIMLIFFLVVTAGISPKTIFGFSVSTETLNIFSLPFPALSLAVSFITFSFSKAMFKNSKAPLGVFGESRNLTGRFRLFTYSFISENGSVRPIMSMVFALTNSGMVIFNGGAVTSLPAIRFCFVELAQLLSLSQELAMKLYSLPFSSCCIVTAWFIAKSLSSLKLFNAWLKPKYIIEVEFSSVIQLIVGAFKSGVNVCAMTVSDKGPSFPLKSTADIL